MTIETARLRLRRLTHADAAFILELLTDPEFLTQVGDRGVHDLDAARRYVTAGPGASYACFGFGLNLMELKESASPIGLCGLLRRASHPDVEIGFALLPRARGQGFALEAAAATLAWGVDSLRLRRIVALTAPENAASIRVLERIGLRFERMVLFADDGRESRLFVFEAPASLSAQT